MKRKHQESIINLAFNELKNETEKKVLEANPLDKEGQKEYEFVSCIRESLKQSAQSTPECQMSVDRIRDAILNQNIRETRNPATFWSWASVGVAACAFLFVLNNNRHMPAEPRLVTNISKPSIIEENNPLVNRPLNNSAASMFEPQDRTEIKEIPVAAAAKPLNRRAVEPSHREWADINTTIANRAAETLSSIASRSDAMRNSHTGTSLAVLGGTDNKHELKAPEPASEPIILINADTDNDTGAQVATEVDSVENVHIGG